MAGFNNNGKSNGGDLARTELKELSDRIVAIKAEIVKIKGKAEDKSKLDLETRRVLATKYVEGAAVSRELANRCMDEELQQRYEEYAKKWSKKAEEFGSSMQLEIPKTTLDDVKGLDGVKEIVKTFIFMVMHPEISKVYKIEGGFGLFMYGAPGTGKTMFAKAVANALQLPLFVVEPSDIFKSYVGESEAAVKQLFDQINLCKDGAVVFIDECDELFSKRSENSKDYKSAVTNQLLQNLNGFNTDGAKRILIAATNLPWNIDSAYLRYKRFSHHVHITPPDATAMRAIVQGKIADVPIDGVSVDDILFMLDRQCVAIPKTETSAGREQSYYSSADVCGIVEEACRLAVEQLIKNSALGDMKEIPKESYPKVTREMFETAIRSKAPSITASVLKKYNDFKAGQS